MPAEIYRDNVAYVHHRDSAGFAQRVGRDLLKVLRSHGVATGHVLDLGCGDGSWLRTLTATGFTATGIDQSQTFVGLARRAAPRASVYKGSIYRARFPACDAITALGEVFNYLSPRSLTAGSLLRVFRRAHAALRPGGLLICDLLVVGRPMRYELSRSGRDWAVWVQVSEDVRRWRLSRKIVAFRRRGAACVRQDETHVLRVPTRSSVLSDLRRAGFVAKAAARFGSVALLPRRTAFIASKPG
jgi:SAM-dependent methyltransferase